MVTLGSFRKLIQDFFEISSKKKKEILSMPLWFTVFGLLLYLISFIYSVTRQNREGFMGNLQQQKI